MFLSCTSFGQLQEGGLGVIVRLSAAFHPAKRHGEQNAERPINADGGSPFRFKHCRNRADAWGAVL